MDVRQKFYKSDEWQAFRRVIIAERTEDDGFVRCAECGKPILKKYDLIIHHKDELDDSNVFDATVALNPDNVVCVHFKCHNKIHERFGFNKGGFHRPKKKVYIVYGAPCSGKSTWVSETATESDIIVDIDSIYQCISNADRYAKTDDIKSVAFEIRSKLYDIIKFRSGNWHNAYIIYAGARSGDRERLSARVNADDMVYIDTPKEICLERARDNRPAEWISFVENWFDTYQP